MSKKKRKANAKPAGGGGGGWKEMNESMAKNRLKGNANQLNKENIPGYYRMRDEGMTDEQIVADYQAGLLTSGTSIFDPVLCELAYKWFCPPGGMVLDPFAGGSVRGVVASKLGRQYLGIDLSARQVEANEGQAKAICTAPMPTWLVGNSENVAKLAKNLEADFIFSCPPYFDLEVYSEDPDDLSTMTWENFKHSYKRIVAEACAKLKSNRFACFVVGDVRDERGMYRGLPGLTVEAFRAAGLEYYNEAILVTAVGSLPIRIKKQWEGARKLGKTHQNVLVFLKGDPKKAAEAVGPCEFGDLPAPEGGSQDEQLKLSIGGEV